MSVAMLFETDRLRLMLCCCHGVSHIERMKHRWAFVAVSPQAGDFRAMITAK